MAAVFTGLSLSFVVICVLVHSRDFAVVVFARLKLIAPMPTTATIQARAANPGMVGRQLIQAAPRILSAVGDAAGDDASSCVFTSSSPASGFSISCADDGAGSPTPMRGTTGAEPLNGSLAPVPFTPCSTKAFPAGTASLASTVSTTPINRYPLPKTVSM